METFEPGREQQIWQRVRPEGIQRMDLRAMQLAALESGAAYRRLAGMLTGANREAARFLASRSREEAAMLSGLHRLSTGTPLPGKAQPAPQGTASQLLEQCYRRTCQALGEYTARSAEGLSGPVYQILAQQAQSQCAQIARLLGEIS